MDRQRIINSMDWMIEDLKWRHDTTGIEGNYSPELREAMDVLAELKKEEN